MGSELEQLIQDYVDGSCTAAQRDDLARRVQDDPIAAGALEDALALESLLIAAHTSEPRPEAIARRIRERMVIAFPGARRGRRLAWTAAAAAVLAAALGAVLLRPASSPAPSIHSVVEGHVDVGGVRAVTVADGEQVRTAVDSRAVLALSDGSVMELAPASSAVVRGRSGKTRQTVELLHGKAGFRVASQRRQFRVLTRVGRVTVLGTQFTVESRIESRRSGEGEDGALTPTLAVEVAVGRVEVEVAGLTSVLEAGQSRTFADESGAKSGRKARHYEGRIASLSGGTLVVERRSDGGAKTETASIDSSTSILLERAETEAVPGEGGRPHPRRKFVPGSTADLRVGRRVRVTETVGKATHVALLADPPRKEGGEREATQRAGGGNEMKSESDRPRRSEGDGRKREDKRSSSEGSRRSEGER